MGLGAHALSGKSTLPDWYGSLATRGLAVSLGIEIVELSRERVVATMPVDDRTRQPFGLLHGGAFIALAETVASFGAVMQIDHERFAAVGLEINGNHLRGGPPTWHSCRKSQGISASLLLYGQGIR